MAVAVVVLVGASRGAEAEIIRNKIPKKKNHIFQNVACKGNYVSQSKQ